MNGIIFSLVSVGAATLLAFTGAMRQVTRSADLGGEPLDGRQARTRLEALSAAPQRA
jgi:hypothetical protein